MTETFARPSVGPDPAGGDDVTVPGLGWLSGPEPVVAGVAARVATRLGAELIVVRFAFLVLASAVGFGIVVYAGLWFMLRGKAPTPRPVTPAHNVGVVALTVAGLVWVGGRVSIPVPLIAAVALVLFGFALSGDRGSAALRSTVMRTMVGVALIGVGVITTLDDSLARVDRLDLARSTVALVVIVGGMAVIGLPTVAAIAQSARDDRRARIRAEERADVAAHLHDSVLQTLTLIQNRADDPAATAALAHRQERELRQWLYGGPDLSAPPTRFAQALEQVAAEVEDTYLRAVECVVVGDCDLTTEAQAVVAAAREAIINAAKFAQVAQISVYADVGDDTIVCYVRDRGVGFDPDQVPDDRRGITVSIVERIERCGGKVTIKAAHDAGVEVRMQVWTGPGVEAPR